MNMDDIWVQVPFIVACLFTLFRISAAMKKGLVKEICGLISAIVASILALLIAFGVRKYFSEDRVAFVITIVLVIIMAFTMFAVNIFLTTLKLIAKLPGISFVNRILGAVVGVAEVVVVIWAVYCIVIIMGAGSFGEWIQNCASNNPVMKYLYQNNPLYSIVADLNGKLSEVDIWGKLGM